MKEPPQYKLFERLTFFSEMLEILIYIPIFVLFTTAMYVAN